MEFRVPGMNCGHCTAAIEKGVKAADGEARVATDLASKTVTVETALPPDAVAQAIRAAGYEATPL